MLQILLLEKLKVDEPKQKPASQRRKSYMTQWLHRINSFVDLTEKWLCINCNFQ